MHDIIPILNKVVVKPEEKVEKTDGGIYIPETAQKKGRVGVVIAKGPDVETINVGDKVFFGDYVGTWILVDKIEYIVLVDKDIMVILKEQDIVTDTYPMGVA